MRVFALNLASGLDFVKIVWPHLYQFPEVLEAQWFRSSDFVVLSCTSYDLASATKGRTDERLSQAILELPGVNKVEMDNIVVLSPHPRFSHVGGLQESLNRRLESLSLSVRAEHCLGSKGIKYVGELVRSSEQDLLKIGNFGRSSLREVKEALREMGLRLEMADHPVVKEWQKPVE